MFFRSLCTISEINLEDTFARLEKYSSKLDVFSLAYSYLCTDSSAHVLGGGSRHIEKDVYERYLEVFKSRKFDQPPLKIRQRERPLRAFITPSSWPRGYGQWSFINSTTWADALLILRWRQCESLKTGISRSTESHVFFIYIGIAKSGGSIGK